MLSSKKVRTAARAKKRTIAEQHDEGLERPRHSSIDDGVSPGVAAQLSGIMPVAVVVFTSLAFASLWRSTAECSEAAKALIRVELCPDDVRLVVERDLCLECSRECTVQFSSVQFSTAQGGMRAL